MSEKKKCDHFAREIINVPITFQTVAPEQVSDKKMTPPPSIKVVGGGGEK